MQAITAGHLSSNGGVRGHSAGDFFPYRVVIVGTMEALTYIVVRPDGTYFAGYDTSKAACQKARDLFQYG